MDVSENSGFSPKWIHFNRVFHYFHHPFWGTLIFGNTQIDVCNVQMNKMVVSIMNVFKDR